MKENTVVAFQNPSDFQKDPLTEVLQAGARELLAQAVEAEVSVFLGSHAALVDAAGRRRVVRNGYLPERFIQTGIGPVSVRQPRVRDRGDGAIRFTSAILPRYLRRAKSLEDLLPWLYLKGMSTGDFGEALSGAGFESSAISAGLSKPPRCTRARFEVWMEHLRRSFSEEMAHEHTAKTLFVSAHGLDCHGLLSAPASSTGMSGRCIRVRTLSCAEQYRSRFVKRVRRSLTYRESLDDIETCLNGPRIETDLSAWASAKPRSGARRWADANERRELVVSHAAYRPSRAHHPGEDAVRRRRNMAALVPDQAIPSDGPGLGRPSPSPEADVGSFRWISCIFRTTRGACGEDC